MSDFSDFLFKKMVEVQLNSLAKESALESVNEIIKYFDRNGMDLSTIQKEKVVVKYIEGTLNYTVYYDGKQVCFVNCEISNGKRKVFIQNNVKSN